MKTNLMLMVFCIGAFQFLTATSNAQDLTRTQGLVNQALQLADAARANSYGASVQPPIQQGWSNPFSTAQTTVTSAHPGTGVAVTGSNIRINAGGLQLDVPRTGGVVSYPPVSSPAIGAPPVGATAANAMQTVHHWRNFADAISSFHAGKYDHASSLILQVSPTPETYPAFNHFHSLCTFAEGNYDRSAEYAYAGLAQSQPIYNWDQLRGYYNDPAIYAQQYQVLKTKAAANDASVSTQFLLGYHHLMLGHREHASQVFEHVLTRVPNDPVIQHTLTISQQLPPQPR